ncbi:hypothetical protein RC74_11910 [Falsihalocynthiibacter arcticus]|uniref:Tripartite tricarboxylate transporter TctB family protein n=1 Tax=Falsihalocynthiibacter arcticus TaxID=1579316 RepID=A0A126V6P5_9RHOB|nr:hypothetical protein RC74_11910 [Falsihalocynthiibacter arcticus]
MDNNNDISVLRARDFWAALVLIAISAFFLWRTSFIPLFGSNRAGVSGASWYNSAAIVPLGVFGALFILGLVLLITAIRAGGAKTALTAVGIGWNRFEAIRFSTIAIIIGFYIVGLVPRVDFILCSGLLITALIYGFHTGNPRRMITSAIAVFTPAAYALAVHLPQSEWAAPHDDDWLTLAVWIILSGLAWLGPRDAVARAIPIIAIITPIILVCAMAFGFRQNVPNRSGLIFSQIQYQYYVNIRPIWRK